VTQHKLISQFRIGLLVQMLAVPLLLAGGIWYLTDVFHDRLGRMVYWVAGLMALFGLWLMWEAFFRKMYRLEIRSDGIRRTHFLTKRDEFYPIENLERIDTGVHQISNANGPLTEPVPELTLVFHDGKSFDISPRIYENFYDIGLYVARLHNQITDKKLELLAEQMIKQKLREYEQRKQQKS